MIQGLKKTTSITISSSRNVCDATLKCLRYGTERKVGVILNNT